MTTHREAPNKKRELSDSNGLGMMGLLLAIACTPSAALMIFFAAVEGVQGIGFLLAFFISRYLTMPLSIAGVVLGVLSIQKEKHQSYGRAAVLLSSLTLAALVFMSSAITA